MSKQTKRKITVELPKNKDVVRPSVFERLGTKNLKSSSKKSEYCRQWAQNGNCAYGKSCKFASTHTLVSPSKRAANKDSDQKRLLKDDPKSRLHSTVVVRSDRSPGEIDNWDQNDLEYADTDVLEKRRQQLQRELDLQLKMDGKDKKKKEASSSSSSRSSSSSSVSSSTSDGSSSSTSSDRNARKKEKKSKLKRNCSSSTDGEVTSKRKYTKDDTSKRDKSENKKTINKKDDRLAKKTPIKKKTTKSTLGRKSFSPGRKTGGTPPIQLKALSKVYGSSKHGKSPQRRDRNKSVSPSPNKDRDRDRGKDRDKERDRERDRDRNRGRSRSRRGRSRSLRRHRSHSKDIRRKDSSERIRPNSPKKQIRRDASPDRNRKTSESKDRDRNRDHKDKSLEKRKDKHEDKDRLDRKEKIDRGRDRTKDLKKDDSSKRSKGGRERGSGRSGKEPDKGLAKPNKPMERLLPRPEERLAALAAITNKVLDVDKVSTTSKDRQDSERGNRKQDRERGNKRGERISSLDRDPGDYDTERQYDRSRPIEDYNRVEDGYSDGPREDDRSPGYSRDRRYEPGYDLAGPQRSYPEGDDRMYMGDHRGYDERRRDRSWEGRAGGSMDRERPYMHPRKEWDGEEYRPGGEWGRERHWPMHEPPLGEWGDKDPDMEGWHHRGPGPHGRPRGPEEYGRNMRKDRGDKRRPPPRPEPEAVVETPPVVAPPPARTTDAEEDKPIPDDLSEISDDPDDILNREDMVEQPVDEESQASQALPEDNTFKPDTSENQSTQDTSGAGDDKESQEGKDDEVVSNLDFEEISDGELEEERTRGLGDALGVDWASLVADVQRRDVEAPIGSALSRWNPQRVLAKLGLSVEMAGTETVQAILDANTEEQRNEENANNEEKVQGVSVEDIHPVAAIQVAIKKRALERAALFGTGCEIRRALSGRRDLAVRRHLCRLPVAERVAPPRHSPHRSLFHAARALLMQQPLPA